MPRLSILADDFAERFNFEPSRVAGIVKALRDEPRQEGMEALIKAGPRGVNAPNATALDAARILIAMMLRVKHHEAPEAVRLFGAFPLGPILRNDTPVEQDKEQSYRAQAPVSCEDALAKALEFYGHEGAAEVDERNFTFSIHRDLASASVTVGIWAGDDDPRWESDDFSGFDYIEFRYLHPEFGPSIANGGELTPELRAAWRCYRSGFHEIPTLNSGDLAEIGQVIAGHLEPLRPET
ncbi:hypothetical protein [Novosphingobium humi]|uniref:Uncharacterized protein n=1 Tax=Novosphingobium humi TaxID=2282397 RepID=A0ABY7TW78_9SPHN|nr:hypothetical protein [Novosphingobium humi]WCT77512.1 hypothetical protein PQ457_00525 [Novosphingobium humi]